MCCYAKSVNGAYCDIVRYTAIPDAYILLNSQFYANVSQSRLSFLPSFVICNSGLSQISLLPLRSASRYRYSLDDGCS